MNVWIVISAVLGALVVLLGWLLLRAARPPEPAAEVTPPAPSAEDAGARRAEAAAEVASAVQERDRSRFLAELASTLDLDEVLDRLLEGAAGLVGAEAAVVRLEPHPPTGNGDGLVRTRGRSAAEDEEGLRVPLPHLIGLQGELALYGRQFDSADSRRLEELLEQAAPAIENARRFREVRRLAEIDALTGLHNRRYFHQTLGREIARAHRYGRRLALIVFDVDDFKNVTDRVGHLAGDAVLAELAERIRSVLRRADVPCRVGGDEFAVIMPESGLEQADQLCARLQAAVAGEGFERIGRLDISAGAAELRLDDDAASLFTRADSSLYKAKGTSVEPDGLRQ
jgi:diguanylate cyclase (GGDEF)-like protein